MIEDTENTNHGKAPTLYTTQIQKEAQESELQHLSYGQKAKGIPPSFCMVLSDLEKTKTQGKFGSQCFSLWQQSKKYTDFPWISLEV